MKFILGTNFWSHHQIPVAEELVKILGPEHFRLALFEEVTVNGGRWGGRSAVSVHG